MRKRIKWPFYRVQFKRMMDQFKIYVEQLRDGHTEELRESFSPDFLEIRERDLAFHDPVDIQGEVYLADEMLILHIDIKTVARMPCIICSEPVKVEVSIPGFYHAVPLNEVKSGIYNFKELLKETVLLETPSLAECCSGKCPQRQELQKYFKKESSDEKEEKGHFPEGYHPFNVL
jgi:uncharacterized metal-binding protein YceD (DUF177 family)